MIGQSASNPHNRAPLSTALALVFFILITIPAASVMAAAIHVPADQPTIQAGIDAAADGDTVLVANGLYTGDGNRDIDFHGKAITVKSAGETHFCIIDCGRVDSPTAHRGFIFQSGESEKSVVQGFTIRNGYGTTFGGGAILCQNSSPRIAYNILTGNRATVGGAIVCGNGASPTIVGNIITGNRAHDGGGIYCSEGSSPRIALNTISHNVTGSTTYGYGGGGIFCGNDSIPTIVENTFIGNEAGGYMEAPSRGGAICCFSSKPGEISKNVFRWNDADLGGGIYLIGGSSFLVNNIFVQNHAGSGGGIAFEWGGNHTINSSTFYGNSAGEGGGIYFNRSFHGPSPGQADSLVIVNSILWNDEAGWQGPELYVCNYTSSYPCTIKFSHCDVEGGTGSCVVDDDVTFIWGEGMITGDPEFAAGPGGDHYLSQFTSGQAVQSPCVDSGDFSDARVIGSTRTDGLDDTGVADMGWHHFVTVRDPDTTITSGPEWGVDSPMFTFAFSGRNHHGSAEGLQYSWKVDSDSWSPFSTVQHAVLQGLTEGAHTFSVRTRDLEGRIDNTPAVRTIFVYPWEADEGMVNMVTGPGPGRYNPPLVRTPAAQWLAYGVPGYGVNVACGDLHGDGASEVITGPGPGQIFGPHVRCWSMSGTPVTGGSFMAYGTHRHGVNVAAGDIDGDGKDEIITGAGPGPVFGAHVRGWNHDGSGTVLPIPGVNFFAYNTPRFGVKVATGDIDGDGFDEIITGAGPGPVFGAHVRGWNHDDGGSTTPIPGVNFFAYNTPRFGVEVAAGDIDGDGIDEILTAPGPGPSFSGHIRGWNFDGGNLTLMGNVNFIAFPYYGTWYGAKVSAGDADQDGVDEILTLQGPDPEAKAYLHSYKVRESRVDYIADHSFLAYNDWMTYGGNIAGVRAE